MSLATEYTITIRTPRELPDPLLFCTFLWGDDHDFDSEGDSRYPGDTSWTYLYMKSRELDRSYFEIRQDEDSDDLYHISSTDQYIVYRVGYFLCRSTDGDVLLSDTYQDYRSLEGLLGEGFDALSSYERVTRKGGEDTD